jgi:hypothetical protein
MKSIYRYMHCRIVDKESTELQLLTLLLAVGGNAYVYEHVLLSRTCSTLMKLHG